MDAYLIIMINNIRLFFYFSFYLCFFIVSNSLTNRSLSQRDHYSNFRWRRLLS